MTDEVIFRHGTTLVRRLRLDPGDAMPWHRDPFHRITVVLHGDAIAIEFRDGTPSQRHQVTPGHVDRDEPEGRIHRGVNVGRELYEEVTIFFLDKQDAVPQPGE